LIRLRITADSGARQVGKTHTAVKLLMANPNWFLVTKNAAFVTRSYSLSPSLSRRVFTPDSADIFLRGLPDATVVIEDLT